ncbi:MAG TPA: DUF3275 family protein [Candidatus Thiothrix moscowensis]|uniref:DUF3275 family protein n=1 Tax=unclassified Thiothrix TaxID=2636184 RepID=UPI0025E0169D|nr:MULTISPECIES: DUF3275 family protein [unclassified Thiothrix]HRJ52202.1 DUF3275 family protein [Candidatus Thiothrix moscowensis]HRJ92517.1 DUF3275 family protein [Candidatus Thiothrix moscowensis]
MKPSHTTPVAAFAVVVPGTLIIRDVPKRAGGSFKVGKLSTQLGQFEVKNPELDQYDAGTYSGNFAIERIYPSHYIAGGKIVIEMRAVLSSFALAGFDAETGEVETLDVDPAEEEAKDAVTVAPEPATEKKPVQAEAATDVESAATGEAKGTEAATDDADKQVMSVEEERAFRDAQMDKDTFGDLYPLEAEVKLDPTVGRTKLRSQCDRLKSLGYKFVAARQVWVKA